MTDEMKALIVLAVAMSYVIPLAIRLRPMLRCPLRRMIEYCRRSAMEFLLVAIFVGGIVYHGATKGTNGTDHGEATSPPASPSVLPPRNGGSANDEFRFVAFEVSSNAVMFAATLPTGLSFPEGKIDLYATCDLGTNFWEHVGYYDIAASETNLTDTVLLSEFPFTSMSRLFLMLGTRADFDGDGLIDVRERLMYGTRPDLSDTDGDGLLDGDELALVPPLDPLNPDSDDDGYTDGEESLAGTSPVMSNDGAGSTIRYYYDTDDRLIGAYSGSDQASSASELSFGGNPTRQTSR